MLSDNGGKPGDTLITVINAIVPVETRRQRKQEQDELLLRLDRDIRTAGSRVIRGPRRLMTKGITLVEKPGIRQRLWPGRTQRHYGACVFHDRPEGIVKTPTSLAVLGDGRVFCSGVAPRKVEAAHEGLNPDELVLPQAVTPTAYVKSLERGGQIAALTRILDFLGHHA